MLELDLRPPTAEEGFLMIELLKEKLNRKELQIRLPAFAKAIRFINNCKQTNGYDAHMTRSYGAVDKPSERVDIEILQGKAFK